MAPRKDSQQYKPWVDPIVTSGLDPDGSYGAWFRNHLSTAFEHILDPTDIQQAFDDAFPPTKAHPQSHLSLKAIAALVASMFPTAALIDAGASWPWIQGVRWTKLDDGKCMLSEGVPLSGLPATLTTESHKLLYLPQPERTVWWLRMLFKSDERASFSTMSLGRLYLHCFSRSRDTHDILDDHTFIEYVQATFKESKIVKVAERHFLFKGIAGRTKHRDAKWVLAKKRRQDHKRLETAGLLMPPRSRFASFLSQDPLLSLPLTDKARLTKDGQPAPSSYTQRLDRRLRKDPKEPLGDEEPGFPGLSIKLMQRDIKEAERERERKWEEASKAFWPATQTDWTAAAAEVLATLPT